MMQSSAILTSLITALATAQVREPLQAASKASAISSAVSRRAAVDSVRALRAARRAQERFESVRRANLPFRSGGPRGACDLQIGRFCYWHDDGASTQEIPPEPERITRARDRFLATLADAARLVGGDEWVVGQRVRYLLEAGHTADAVTTATDCRASPWWCGALAGLALHQAGAYALADSAFSSALAAMSPEQRCRWTDISLLLEGSAAKRYRELACSARDAFERRFWWLSRPLYSRPGNDIRTEFYARRAMSRLEQQARSAYNLGWGSDVDELLMRFGWPTWWTRDYPSSALSGAGASIVGHEPTPSFFFHPEARLLDASPADAQADDWQPARRFPPARYAPAYAGSFSPVRTQVSVFRRGDSALVVATYEPPQDSLFDAGIEEAALAIGSDETAPITVVRQPIALGALEPLVAKVPWAPMLASVELIAAPASGGPPRGDAPLRTPTPSERRGVARARFGLRPELRRGNTGRLVASDILLYRSVTASGGSLGDVARHALSAPRIATGGRVGLYWELYGVRPTGEPLSITLTVERVGAGWMTRAAEALRLAAKTTPLRVRWQEVPKRDSGIATRAITVDLSALPAGRYRMQLSVAADDGSTAVSERFVELFTPR